jgi:hypothetical protein
MNSGLDPNAEEMSRNSIISSIQVCPSIISTRRATFHFRKYAT